MKFPTKIKGLSESRRMPRLNKIRLGAKFQNDKGVEYPAELPFFLLPEEVATVHGGKIKDIDQRAKILGVKNSNVLKFINENSHRLAEELPVMVPVEDIENSFPQSYTMFGKSAGVKCIGNGETAQERVEGTNDFKEIKCPCNNLKSNENPRGACAIKARLQVMLPEVSAGGVFQIDIGSINSIIDINSGIDYVKAMIGRVAMIPLKLRRIPTETHHGGKKQIHFTCQLTFSGDIKAVVALKEEGKMMTHKQVLSLEEPDYSNPKLDAVDAVYAMPDNIKAMVGELQVLGRNKKLSKAEMDDIKTAIDKNDEPGIEFLHDKFTSRVKTGSSQEDVMKKLTEPEPVATVEPTQEKASSGNGKKDPF